jgi:DNA modification methylase
LVKGKPKVFKNKIHSQFHSEVWNISPERNSKHPAPFPEKLVENCILLTTQENDLILDPFMGYATTGIVANRCNRDFFGIEIDSEYFKISKKRLEK